MADWETRAVRSDGCRIAYDCRQGEGPEVVLLHGYGLDRTMWAPQLVALPTSPSPRPPRTSGPCW